MRKWRGSGAGGMEYGRGETRSHLGVGVGGPPPLAVPVEPVPLPLVVEWRVRRVLRPVPALVVRLLRVRPCGPRRDTVARPPNGAIVDPQGKGVMRPCHQREMSSYGTAPWGRKQTHRRRNGSHNHNHNRDRSHRRRPPRGQLTKDIRPKRKCGVAGGGGGLGDERSSMFMKIWGGIPLRSSGQLLTKGYH